MTLKLIYYFVSLGKRNIFAALMQKIKLPFFYNRIGCLLAAAASMIALPDVAKAQLSISLNSGIGTYQMGDLKSYQQRLRSSWPVKGQITSSFPAYLYYEISALNRFENNLIAGAVFSFGSTGGRIYYSDYSGSLKSDQLVSFFSWTASIGKSKTFFNGKLDLQADLQPGIVITQLKLSNSEVIGTTTSNSDFSYQSVNFLIQPTVRAIYKFGSASLTSFVGYNWNLIQGDFYAKNNNGGGPYNFGNIHADWSGLRAGLGLGYRVNSKTSYQPGDVSFGLGVGLDYGGLGANVLVYPQRNFGVFAGAGYVFAGVGINGGIKLRVYNPNTKAGPYVVGMYGYNAAIVTNVSAYNKIFYGPSIGIGYDFDRHTDGHWSAALLLPIRGSEVDDYVNALKAQGYQFKNPLLPIAISVGYRFIKN